MASRYIAQVATMTNLARFDTHRQAIAILRYICYATSEPLLGEDDRQAVYFRSPTQIDEIVAQARKLPPCPIRYHRGYEWRVNRPASKGRREIFDLITDRFGDRCHACKVNPAMIIDHDHIDNLVRGAVCHECNNHLDKCLHNASAACHYARYLNTCTAKELRLSYPKVYQALGPRRETAISILGFDPLDRSAWPNEQPAQWSWKPPPNPKQPVGVVAISNHSVPCSPIDGHTVEPIPLVCSGVEYTGARNGVLPRLLRWIRATTR